MFRKARPELEPPGFVTIYLRVTHKTVKPKVRVEVRSHSLTAWADAADANGVCPSPFRPSDYHSKESCPERSLSRPGARQTWYDEWCKPSNCNPSQGVIDSAIFSVVVGSLTALS